MRIALALEYPLMRQGGTEVLVQELIRGLSRHCEIVLVSGDRERKELPEEFSRLIRGHLHWQIGATTAQAARTLAEELRRQELDLAHFHFGGTYEWRSNRFWQCPIYHLARSSVPCLSTNHLAVEWLNCGCDPARPGWQKLFFQAFASFSRSVLYRRLAFEVCVSKHDQQRIVGMFPLFKRKILQRYHSLLRAGTPPPNLQDRAPVVLCVGTIGGRKAQWILVEAFGRIAAKHAAWRLDLIGRPGDPTDVARINEIVATHGLAGRINLPGRLSDEETIEAMKKASIIAMPSLQEGLGLSLQEALFHGCVGLGTRAGGIPELIDDGVNGLLVPPGDVGALSAALDRLLSDGSMREKLRGEARPSIMRKGMTSEAMVESYVELYGRVGRKRLRI